MNSDRQDQSNHPDIRDDAPGRIPESLINAAIDGEINDDIQREIAHALRYDPVRAQEVRDTKDAINALQMPIATPDFSSRVLDRADRHRRFIPASWRKHVRAGRMGIAAMLLFSLMTVAGLQRLYPRLTTLGAHPTLVLDVEQAVGHDASAISQNIKDEIGTVRQSVASILPSRLPVRSPIRSVAMTNASSNRLSVPGQMNFQLSSSQADLSQVRLVSFVSTPQRTHPHDFTGVYVSGIGQRVAAVYMTKTQQTDLPPQSHARLFFHSPIGSSGGACSSSWTILAPSSPSGLAGSSGSDHGSDHGDTIQVDIAALP